jgi:hypothetical protein
MKSVLCIMAVVVLLASQSRSLTAQPPAPAPSPGSGNYALCPRGKPIHRRAYLQLSPEEWKEFTDGVLSMCPILLTWDPL